MLWSRVIIRLFTASLRHEGNNYALPDFTRRRIGDGPLRADHRRLFMLYWAAWASDVLITPLVLNESSVLRARKWLRALFEIPRDSKVAALEKVKGNDRVTFLKLQQGAD